MRRGQSLSLYSSAWLKLNFEEKEQPRTKSAIKKKRKRKRKRKKEKEKNILIKMIFTKQFRDLPFTLYPSHIRRYEVYNNVYIQFNNIA